jgi:hypothetical protein
MLTVIKLKQVIASSIFFKIIVILFFVQALWFAGSIQFGIPPDERYHFPFIEYYAEQPIFSGPVLGNQASSTFNLGELQRTPSYLYHYVLSFPLKAINAFTESQQIQVFSLRLINIGFGLSFLLVLRKLLRMIGTSEIANNLTVFALVSTGMFVWLSAAINYDNLANLTFLLLVYNLLALQKKPRLVPLLGIIFFVIATILIKITFLPTVALAILFYLALNVKSYRSIYNKIKSDSKSVLTQQKGRITTIFVGVGVVLMVLLFVERIGLNIVRYRAIEPSCFAIHARDDCLKFMSKGIEEKAAFRAAKAAGKIPPVNVVDISRDWFVIMYQRLYFYFGHKSIAETSLAKTIAVLFVVFIAYLFVVVKGSIFSNKEQVLLFALLLAYVAMLFALNVLTVIKQGRGYGWQGRYLLPVLPFLYMFIVGAAVKAYQVSTKPRKQFILGIGAVLILGLVYSHSPVISFYRGSDANWYTSSARSINLQIKRILN